MIRGEPVSVRGRKKPTELLFNLEHPEELAVVTEVNEERGKPLLAVEQEARTLEGVLLLLDG